MSSIGEFFVELGFDIDDAALAEFDKQVKNLGKTVLAIGAAASAAAAGIGLFVAKTAQNIDALGDFAEANDVSVESLQEIGHAAQISGSSLEAVQASVAGLNKTIGEAVLGIGRGAKTFEKLGMSAKNADGSVKSFDELMSDVSDKMQGISRQEQIALAEKLGIDASLVPMLAKGRGALEELREEARAFGVVTQDGADTAGAFTDSLDRTKFLIKALGNSIAVELMPEITKMMDKFRDWMVKNREIIQARVEKAINLVTFAVQLLSHWTLKAISILDDLVSALANSTAATWTFYGAMFALIALKIGTFIRTAVVALSTLRIALLSASAAALPFTLITLAIGAVAIALGLLIEDFIGFKNGSESVIGDLAAKFPWIKDAIDAVSAAVDDVVAFFKEQFETLMPPIMQLVEAISRIVTIIVGALWPVVKFVFQGFVQLLSFIIPIIVKIIGFLAKQLVGAIAFVIEMAAALANGFADALDFIVSIVKALPDVFLAAFDFIGEIVGGITNWIASAFNTAFDIVGGIIEKIKSAIKFVGKLIGLSEEANEKAPSVQTTEAIRAGVQQAPGTPGSLYDSRAMPGRMASRSAAANAARFGNTATTNTTNSTTTVGEIKVISPDPNQSGKQVRAELERMNRKTTRNGQSAVAG